MRSARPLSPSTLVRAHHPTEMLALPGEARAPVEQAFPDRAHHHKLPAATCAIFGRSTGLGVGDLGCPGWKGMQTLCVCGRTRS